jgi:hypothetical protein
MPPCTNHISVYMCKNAPNTAPRAKLFVCRCKDAPNTAPRAKLFVCRCKDAPNTAPRAKLFVYMCKDAPNTAPRAKLFVCRCKDAPNTAPRAKLFVCRCKDAPNTAPRAKLFVCRCKDAPNTAPRAKRAQSDHSYSSTSVHATHLKVIYKSALPILESEPISFACGKAHGSRSHRPSTSSGSSADFKRTTPSRVRQSPPATKMHPGDQNSVLRRFGMQIRFSCCFEGGERKRHAPHAHGRCAAEELTMAARIFVGQALKVQI